MSARVAHLDWAKKYLSGPNVPDEEGKKWRVFYDLAIPRHLDLFEDLEHPTPENTTMSFPFLTLFGTGKMERLIIAVSEVEDPAKPQDREFVFILTAGRFVSGHGGIMHGGFTSSLVDELFGEILYLTRTQPSPPYPFPTSPLANDFKGAIPSTPATDFQPADIKIPHMTAYLKTTFKSPVILPSALMVRAKVSKEEGRKVFVEGEVLQFDEMDDGWTERVCTQNEILFILLKENAPKL